MHVSPQTVALIFVSLLAATTLLRLWLASRQIRHVARHRSQVRAVYAATIDTAAH